MQGPKGKKKAPEVKRPDTAERERLRRYALEQRERQQRMEEQRAREEEARRKAHEQERVARLERHRAEQRAHMQQQLEERERAIREQQEREARRAAEIRKWRQGKPLYERIAEQAAERERQEQVRREGPDPRRPSPAADTRSPFLLCSWSASGCWRTSSTRSCTPCIPGRPMGTEQGMRPCPSRRWRQHRQRNQPGSQCEAAVSTGALPAAPSGDRLSDCGCFLPDAAGGKHRVSGGEGLPIEALYAQEAERAEEARRRSHATRRANAAGSRLASAPQARAGGTGSSPAARSTSARGSSGVPPPQQQASPYSTPYLLRPGRRPNRQTCGAWHAITPLHVDAAGDAAEGTPVGSDGSRVGSNHPVANAANWSSMFNPASAQSAGPGPSTGPVVDIAGINLEKEFASFSDNLSRELQAAAAQARPGGAPHPHPLGRVPTWHRPAPLQWMTPGPEASAVYGGLPTLAEESPQPEDQETAAAAASNGMPPLEVDGTGAGAAQPEVDLYDQEEAEAAVGTGGPYVDPWDEAPAAANEERLPDGWMEAPAAADDDGWGATAGAEVGLDAPRG